MQSDLYVSIACHAVQGQVTFLGLDQQPLGDNQGRNVPESKANTELNSVATMTRLRVAPLETVTWSKQVTHYVGFSVLKVRFL